MSNDEISSADQDAWIALAAAIRNKLADVVPLIPAMKPDEIHSFVNAVEQARWLALRAAVYDKEVEDELKKMWKD